jgi:hypothetical protein
LIVDYVFPLSPVREGGNTPQDERLNPRSADAAS